MEVVAAIIQKGCRYFATQRGHGEWKGWWDFPGGKIEAGETPEIALKREIKEELDVEISINGFLATIDMDYPKFHLKIHYYLCSLHKGEPKLLEAENARWLLLDELGELKWLPVDKAIIERLEARRGNAVIL